MLKKLLITILWKLPPGQRDWIRSFKRFKFYSRRHPKNQLFIIFIDGSSFHGGLTDRFKGIVSMFLYCLQKNINFRIYYTFPFCLSDYLVPNLYNWQLDENELISYNIFESKYIYLISDPTAGRLTKLHTKKQIHCFANRDIVGELNKINNTDYQWGELFKMLFKPVEALQNRIQSYKSQIGNEYISAVFRFQNLLGDFTEYDDVKELSTNEKHVLIRKCKSALSGLLDQHGKIQILVTSDSNLFIEQLTGIKNIITFPAKRVHIDNIIGEAYNVYMQSFIDFYLLSEGKAVYSIGTHKMYKTEFPLYAAQINNIPFKRIIID